MFFSSLAIFLLISRSNVFCCPFHSLHIHICVFQVLIEIDADESYIRGNIQRIALVDEHKEEKMMKWFEGKSWPASVLEQKDMLVLRYKCENRGHVGIVTDELATEIEVSGSFALNRVNIRKHGNITTIR